MIIGGIIAILFLARVLKILIEGFDWNEVRKIAGVLALCGGLGLFAVIISGSANVDIYFLTDFYDSAKSRISNYVSSETEQEAIVNSGNSQLISEKGDDGEYITENNEGKIYDKDYNAWFTLQEIVEVHERMMKYYKSNANVEGYEITKNKYIEHMALLKSQGRDNIEIEDKVEISESIQDENDPTRHSMARVLNLSEEEIEELHKDNGGYNVDESGVQNDADETPQFRAMTQAEIDARRVTNMHVCGECGMSMASEGYPGSGGCSVSADKRHDWFNIGKTGSSTYSCSGCGSAVRVDFINGSGNCPGGGRHDWRKN